MEEEALHPLFIIFRRDWLSEVTGYSKGYLSRMATGKIPLSRAFIERVCFKLERSVSVSEKDLFLAGESPSPPTPSQSHNE